MMKILHRINRQKEEIQWKVIYILNIVKKNKNFVFDFYSQSFIVSLSCGKSWGSGVNRDYIFWNKSCNYLNYPTHLSCKYVINEFCHKITISERVCLNSESSRIIHPMGWELFIYCICSLKLLEF